jgi:aromatase
MTHTYNEVIIRAELATVFDKVTDITRWPEYFEEYTMVSILNRAGNRITFELTSTEELTWQTTCLVDRDNWLITAKRDEPCTPFKYVRLRWIFRPVAEGTVMVWEQFFEFDPAVQIEFTEEDAVNRTVEYGRKNMERIKAIIEIGEAS